MERTSKFADDELDFASMILAIALLAAYLADSPEPRECACPAAITTRVERTDVGVRYVYTVTNLGKTPINGVPIGTAEDHDAELEQMPSGCERLDHDGDCACSVPSPRGWTGCVGLQEENELRFREFRPRKKSHFLRPGAKLELRVALRHQDPTHETPVFWTIAERGCSFAGHAVRESSR